ncbi:hypothetical protein CIB84_000511 [Bambusicola thoracicus]|uniref:Adenylyl cyclase-associated protein n=1 Tax=Bambusicola thoracicus TaxID=9083 RepID=A0A2P4THB3_BAMTH|nr:hypothetical protein CIB84_000511 [Bambusicola thoracicus]
MDGLRAAAVGLRETNPASVPPQSAVPFLIVVVVLDSNLVVTYIVAVAAGISVAAAFLLPWSMLPDVIDDFKLQHPESRGHEAIFFSFYVFFTKFTSGVSLGISTLSLDFAGYQTRGCSQPSEVNITLKLLVSAVPVGLILLGLLLFKLYPIDEEKRRENKKALQDLSFVPSEDVSNRSLSVQAEDIAAMERLVERLERAVERLETVCQGPGMCGDGSSPGVAQYVQAFDAILSGPVAEYINISKEVGGDVQKHAEMVHAGFMTERSLLVTASQHQQPSENVFSTLLKPISEQIQMVQNLREKNRGSKQFNHLSAVSESIPALGWVAMSPKPGPYVKEMTDAAMFYTNRILKEYKDVDKKQVDWVKAYLRIWTELQAYIKEYHTTGLTWSKTEHQENATNLVINDTELKQVAYVFKCTNSTLQIKGKINSITLDNCKKLGLVFDDVVGIVEIINSRDIKVQVMGKVPTISINKTDGCHVYLSKNSLDCEIVSAKSSEMNVLIPTEGGDFTEFPVPEQFKTVWNGQKLVTTVTEIAG